MRASPLRWLAALVSVCGAAEDKFEVTNVITLDSFACSRVSEMPRCIAATATPHAKDVKRHGVDAKTVESRAQGVFPYDVARVHAHLRMFLKQMQAAMEVKVVFGETWSAGEAKLLRENFGAKLGVVVGSLNDLPLRGAAHVAALNKLTELALQLDGEGLGVADNDDFFGDLMHLDADEATARFAAAPRGVDL
ncbi:hypothetical protein M885DRAFT_549478 [Pelagophyceae sp. CCMP2097]|nr:hypothetical protein M885DRAFT_549478 [Pelagophyceae sp. CCMP2097]|mmetsp:Transcript_15925/g.53678  ORF Transcript_15925/g.53678 Transcript_15925/m.53678 type:complete len:193 (-) Transcript_15925:964-1542(-)